MPATSIPERFIQSIGPVGQVGTLSPESLVSVRFFTQENTLSRLSQFGSGQKYRVWRKLCKRRKMRPAHFIQCFKNHHGTATGQALALSAKCRANSDLPCLTPRFGAFLIVPMLMTVSLHIGLQQISTTVSAVCPASAL